MTEDDEEKYSYDAEERVERYGDDDQDEEETLRERVPDQVPDDVTLFERDGNVHGSDSHGTFRLAPELPGSPEPTEEGCNWVLRYSMDRYGETRYCKRLPAKNFPGYESELCKSHKSGEEIMKTWKDMMSTGYWASTYATFAQNLEPVEFLLAVEMFEGLLHQSRHDFDIETVSKKIDTSESTLIVEDAVEVDMPMPTETKYSFQVGELWAAALDEVKVQKMQDAIFTDGVSKKTTSESADVDGEITDTIEEWTEHHLHLPISRLTKDIKEHLKNGGVVIDDGEDSTITFAKNDYTLDVSPVDEDEVDDSEVRNPQFAQKEFAEQLEKETEEVEVEPTD